MTAAELIAKLKDFEGHMTVKSEIPISHTRTELKDIQDVEFDEDEEIIYIIAG